MKTKNLQLFVLSCNINQKIKKMSNADKISKIADRLLKWIFDTLKQANETFIQYLSMQTGHNLKNLRIRYRNLYLICQYNNF